jgi:hypothetical protein
LDTSGAVAKSNKQNKNFWLFLRLPTACSIVKRDIPSKVPIVYVSVAILLQLCLDVGQNLLPTDVGIINILGQ